MYCVRCVVRSFRDVPGTPQKRASGYTSFVSTEMYGSTALQKSESSNHAFISDL